MPEFQLFIENKNYSSWSFRAWIGLKQAGLPFAEELVPVLKDGDLTVWESLAILEYAADAFPDAGLRPNEIGMPRMPAQFPPRCIQVLAHCGPLVR